MSGQAKVQTISARSGVGTQAQQRQELYTGISRRGSKGRAKGNVRQVNGGEKENITNTSNDLVARRLLDYLGNTKGSADRRVNQRQVSANSASHPGFIKQAQRACCDLDGV